MRTVNWRSVMLCVCILLFSGLLLCGGTRLIGSQQEEAPRDRMVVKAAYLCSAPPQNQETQQGVQEQPKGERTDAALVAVVSPGNPSITLKRDANGNVLFHKSYLKTVYQAFSLGDGFV